MTGKINDREKYGGLSQNPPNYPGHVFTGGRPFKFFFNKFSTEISVFVTC